MSLRSFPSGLSSEMVALLLTHESRPQLFIFRPMAQIKRFGRLLLKECVSRSVVSSSRLRRLFSRGNREVNKSLAIARISGLRSHMEVLLLGFTTARKLIQMVDTNFSNFFLTLSGEINASHRLLSLRGTKYPKNIRKIDPIVTAT